MQLSNLIFLVMRYRCVILLSKMKTKYSIENFLRINTAGGSRINYSKKYIIYLSDLTGTQQIYLKNIEEGGSIRQITSFDDPISSVLCSPTKDELIFSKATKGNEKHQLYLYNIVSNSTKKLTADDSVIHRIGGWSDDGKFITFSSNERNGTDFDVFVMSLETLAITPIYTEGGWCDALGFSPDGSMAAVLVRKTFNDHELFLINLRGHAITHVTPHKGRAVYGRPLWLPDNSGFYYRTSENSEFIRLGFYNLKNKETKIILDSEWDMESATITRDGTTIVVSTNEDGYTINRFYCVPDFQEIVGINLPEGENFGFSWSIDGTLLTFSSNDYNRPSNIYIWSKKENIYTQITNVTSSVPGELFIKEELVHFKSFDGRKIPAFMYIPKTTSGKMPVLVQVHGGPEGQYQPGFAPLTQYFVYHGYIVIWPNVRGSTGYGKSYQALDDAEKRMDSVEDLKYLHKYLNSFDFIDSSKIALMGASYGGYMTLAGLTFQADLWAAGVDIVGISNFVTFLENTSSWRRALREAEYGSLANHTELLKSISPYNSIEKLKAPLFIIHGANDPRVPLSEAEQIEKKLKELDRRVDLLVYHDEGHGLSKLKNRLDAYPKIVNFLDSILKK